MVLENPSPQPSSSPPPVIASEVKQSFKVSGTDCHATLAMTPSPIPSSVLANEAKQSVQPQAEEIATPLARNDEATPRLMPKKTGGLTPALRFPEFSGEWEEKSLKQVCEMQAGKFIPASSIKENQTINLYPCYGGNGLRGYTEEYTHTGEYPLIGRQGALCGNVNFVQGKFYATEHAIVTSPKNKIDSKWLFYQLGRLNLNRLATGQAQPGLSVDTLKSVHSFIPVIEEQQKIADFLTAVDARIAHLQKKHSLLQTYKKGLMQQLFSVAPSPCITTSPLSLRANAKQSFRVSGTDCHATLAMTPSPIPSSVLANEVKQSVQPQAEEIATPLARNDEATPRLIQKETGGLTPALRFTQPNGSPYPDWEEKRLGDVANVYQPETISQNQLNPKGNYLVYGANGIIGRWDKYNHEHSQVAITCRGNTCGYVTFTEPKSWITGNSMVINMDDSKQGNKRFIFYLFTHTDFKYLITGSGQPQITGDIKKHKILIPHPEEQQKIADFLTAVDAKISLTAQAIQHTQTFKKGLLQQLFV